MTAPAIVIDPEALVSEAFGLLAQSTVRRLFVVGRDGVLARRDLLRDNLREDDDIRTDVRRVLRDSASTPAWSSSPSGRGGVRLSDGWSHADRPITPPR
ncbi:CBS domain-containing protein [Umezawaea endophytica]|uniref:CBS domain-containing protein n=1 Tax=Umezawaea endophytica TaxID=1654476 RepID=A0A9X2VVQ9_9PSEU|nr:CBS domain-containing protein [Umezawaea endophytica]MCS7483681.1 CBS domain-containing protein [Umezawaea endophytica]